MKTLARVFETFGKPKAEPISLDEFPEGADSLEAIILGNYYKNAFTKGLFSDTDCERVKALLRNQRLWHGGDVFSEERIKATIVCMQEACEEFSTALKQTVHADTRNRLAQTPDIWQR